MGFGIWVRSMSLCSVLLYGVCYWVLSLLVKLVMRFPSTCDKQTLPVTESLLLMPLPLD